MHTHLKNDNNNDDLVVSTLITNLNMTGKYLGMSDRLIEYKRDNDHYTVEECVLIQVLLSKEIF